VIALPSASNEWEAVTLRETIAYVEDFEPPAARHPPDG
jgi:hypothetical protein